MEPIMNTLPRELGCEIFSFIVPNSSQIEFRKHNHRSRDSYNKRCQKAYINGYLLKNKDNKFLSRVCKKNGKHRYYISREFIDSIEIEQYDREITIYMYEYTHTYVGKDLNKAILELIVG